MKKKFLTILKLGGFTLVEYESYRVSFALRVYYITYKNRKGEVFNWFGMVDSKQKDTSDVKNKDGILVDFKNKMIINRGGM